MQTLALDTVKQICKSLGPKSFASFCRVSIGWRRIGRSVEEDVKKEHTGTITEFDDHVIVQLTRVGLHKHGPCLVRNNYGNFHSYAYKNDRLHGEYRILADDGTLVVRQTWRDDKLHGLYQAWTKDGILINEVFFVDGAREGEGRMYYENGQISDLITYRCGELHGYSINWTVDGELRTVTLYDNGRRVCDHL